MKIKVAVMFGGKSVEHEVSVISGIQAIQNIDKDKYEIIPIYLTKENLMYIGNAVADINEYKDIKALLKKSQQVIMLNENGSVKLLEYPFKRFGKSSSVDLDVVFPIVHGTNVEDGALQGYLKTIGVSFVGSDVTASALGMDKYLTKVILKENEIPVLDASIYTLVDYKNIDKIVSSVESLFNYPVIVKPVNLGSSVGISVAKNADDLLESIDSAFLYATKILVEPAVVNLREINCAVFGDFKEAIASECEEPMHTEDILSYEDKYVSNAKGGKSKGMASVSRKIPADISEEMRCEIREMAIKSFKALGCSGVARIDFLLDGDTNKVYFNEINTIPGSLSFYLWEPIGIEYSELLDRMIQLAIKRKLSDTQITYTFNTNLLSDAKLGGVKGSKV